MENGGVVYHYTVVGVVGILIVAAREEGPQDQLPREVGHRADVFHHRLEDVARRIAVVGSLLFVGELGDKTLVVVEDDGVSASATVSRLRPGHLLHLAVGEQLWLFCHCFGFF